MVDQWTIQNYTSDQKITMLESYISILKANQYVYQ
jgi:hypothetical protein